MIFAEQKKTAIAEKCGNGLYVQRFNLHLKYAQILSGFFVFAEKRTPQLEFSV